MRELCMHCEHWSLVAVTGFCDIRWWESCICRMPAAMEKIILTRSFKAFICLEQSTWGQQKLVSRVSWTPWAKSLEEVCSPPSKASILLFIGIFLPLFPGLMHANFCWHHKKYFMHSYMGTEWEARDRTFWSWCLEGHIYFSLQVFSVLLQWHTLARTFESICYIMFF